MCNEKFLNIKDINGLMNHSKSYHSFNFHRKTTLDNMKLEGKD